MVIYRVFFRLVHFLQSGNTHGMEVVAGFVHDDILEIIVLTPWTEGFEKYVASSHAPTYHLKLLHQAF